MTRQNFYQISLRFVLTVAFAAPVWPSVTTAAAGQSRADMASIACNFSLRLKEGTGESPSVNSLDSSTDCDSYHIYLSHHPTDRTQSTFRVSEPGAPGSMTYHVADMPFDEVVLLFTPRKEPTRVLARRQADRIGFIVGRTSFEQPPPRALLPRSSSRRESSATQVPGRIGTSPALLNELIGSWRTQGAILELRANGTFSKVSNSSYGTFGGVIGVDDNGNFEQRGGQIYFRGTMRERTCAFSLTTQNELVVCDVRYRREDKYSGVELLK